MNKTFVETNNLSSISECLMQLVNAEQAQLDIEQQLEQSNSSSEWSEWRKKAEKALRTVKAKRRLITARLAVLRQEEKERNAENHQQHNDYLIAELRKIVTPSSFARCVYRAAEKMESANGDYNMFDLMKSAIPAPAPVNDVTNGKPLTITLPDTSSKAFWSGSGKSEVFHPETYKRWVKEAIERDCCIARIEVKVK